MHKQPPSIQSAILQLRKHIYVHGDQKQTITNHIKSEQVFITCQKISKALI